MSSAVHTAQRGAVGMVGMVSMRYSPRKKQKKKRKKVQGYEVEDVGYWRKGGAGREKDKMKNSD